MKKRYLVTAIGGDIGASVVRCMEKIYNEGNLIGCDISPYVAGYEGVNEFFLAPPYKEEIEYMECIYRECINRKITHILPMTEGEIKLFDEHRKMFQNAEIKLMINDSDVLSCCFSKFRTAQVIKALGMPFLKTRLPEDDITDLEFPVIVKSDSGCGSKSVRIAYNVFELDIYIQQVENAVIQEYIGTNDEEYTVGVFSDGVEVVDIAFKRILGFGGMSIRVEKVVESEIQMICKKIANYFHLKGAINIQMRKYNNKYYVFEINPRISSTVGFRHQLGFKDVEWWLALLDGNKNILHYIDEKKSVIGIRVLGEKLFIKD